METKCRDCKHWGVYFNSVLGPCMNTNAFAVECDGEALNKAVVEEKALAIVKSGINNAGVVHTTGEFGCVYFEEK